MGLMTLFLIAVGLSMDAFAVAICKGLGMRKMSYKNMFLIAALFGGFQALMPLIGWLLGTQFEQYIVQIDHYIAFFLLTLIGGKMIWEAVGEDRNLRAAAAHGNDALCSCHTKSGESCSEEHPLFVKELVVLAVATSIDALAVGITFAFLKTNIWSAITVIGVITFMLSALGVWIGNRFGSKYKTKAELAGGVVLVLIGLKILLEHLGFLS